MSYLMESLQLIGRGGTKERNGEMYENNQQTFGAKDPIQFHRKVEGDFRTVLSWTPYSTATVTVAHCAPTGHTIPQIIRDNPLTKTQYDTKIKEWRIFRQQRVL